MVTHKHHIIPKHMGGEDTNENLIELTIEEHAEAHKKLYEEHGHWQDRLAWKTLSGQISNAEAAKEARRLANTGRKATEEARRKISKSLTGRKLSEEHKAKIAAKSIFLTDKNPGKNPSPETRARMSRSRMGLANNPDGGDSFALLSLMTDSCRGSYLLERYS